MGTLYSTAQLNRFRREAKKLSRDLSIRHCEALDRIASEHGFPNWSIFVKTCARSDGLATLLHSAEPPIFVKAGTLSDGPDTLAWKTRQHLLSRCLGDATLDERSLTAMSRQVRHVSSLMTLYYVKAAAIHDDHSYKAATREWWKCYLTVNSEYVVRVLRLVSQEERDLSTQTLALALSEELGPGASEVSELVEAIAEVVKEGSALGLEISTAIFDHRSRARDRG